MGDTNINDQSLADESIDCDRIDNEYEKIAIEHDFGTQYHYFKKEIDPRFPEPKVDELKISIFCDANHGHDKVTGRSITGIIAFVGSTPILWESKRQNSVQISTYGAEFTALKRAVEHAIVIRYHLRSMGIKVSKPSYVYVNNRATTHNTVGSRQLFTSFANL